MKSGVYKKKIESEELILKNLRTDKTDRIKLIVDAVFGNKLRYELKLLHLTAQN